MRQLSVIVALLLSAAILRADTCLPGSLEDYVNLGAGGCTVGPALFSSFATLSLLPGATPIPLADISVDPQDITLQPTLLFTVPPAFRSAGPGELFQAFFQFNVGNGSFLASRLSMEGSAASDDGVVTTVGEFCPGGPLDSCVVPPEILILHHLEDDSLTSAGAPFSPTDLLGIRLDIAIDGGLGGMAALTSVTNTIESVESVPEPGASVLMLSGLAVLFLARRRIRRAISNR